MTKEAEDMYRTLIRLYPEDAGALASLAALVYDCGEIDAAAQLLQKSFEIDPSNSIAVTLVLRMKKDGVAE